MLHCYLSGRSSTYTRAILNMDEETGVSIMKIEPKLDSNILIQSN